MNKIKFLIIFLFINLSVLFSASAYCEEPKNTVYIIMRNDDICGLSDPIKERKVFEIFERYDIPQVISVVPFVAEDCYDVYKFKYYPLKENEEIVSILKEYREKGLIEITQHGVTHQTNIYHPTRLTKNKGDRLLIDIRGRSSLYAPANPEGYSEFSGLPYKLQRNKIIWGRDHLQALFSAKIETFIPPWNNLDTVTVKALEDIGFKNCLYGTRIHATKDLNIVNCYHENIFELPSIISKVAKLNQPALVQILYHSWKLSEEEIESLNAILGDLTLNKNVKFITLNQLYETFPQIHSIFELRALGYNWLQKANFLLKENIAFPPYYILNPYFYKKIIYKSVLILLSFLLYLLFLASFTVIGFNFLIKKIGLKKVTGLTVLLLFLVVLNKGHGSTEGLGRIDISIMVFFIATLSIIFFNLGRILKRRQNRLN